MEYQHPCIATKKRLRTNPRAHRPGTFSRNYPPEKPFWEGLGIEVIAANSPQAKGRVERNHGIDQDRLVKELRLAGISSREQANAFLWSTYLPLMNGKFSRPPQIGR